MRCKGYNDRENDETADVEDTLLVEEMWTN